MKPLFLLVALLAPAIAFAAPAVKDDGKPWPEATFEIFTLAPGKHEAFLRTLAEWDEVSVAGGQQPAQLYMHDGGDEWDVLLLRPSPLSPITPAQQAAMDAKIEELRLKTGPAFFLEMREKVASHTDTKTQGPLTAAQWLARLDAWRAAHPEAAKRQ